MTAAETPVLDTFRLTFASRRREAQERHVAFLKTRRTGLDPASSQTAARLASSIDKQIELAQAELEVRRIEEASARDELSNGQQYAMFPGY